MATTTIYVQPANAGPAHTAIFGALPAGGGAGTEGSPYSTFAAMALVVTDTSVDRSGDNLIVNIHPAASFRGGASQSYAVWSGLGRGNNWGNILLQRWQAKIDADPGYADWYPTIDTTQPITAWTQGSITAGVWSAGAGDVYRADVQAGETSWVYFRCWVGHDWRDTRYSTSRLGLIYCSSLADITREGEHALISTGASANRYLYVKTGQNGVDPTTRWGGEVVYTAESGTYSVNRGQRSLYLQNSQNFTWDRLQSNGGRVHVYAGDVAGNVNEQCHFPNHRGHMRCGAGFRVDAASSLPTTEVRKCSAHNMRLDADHPPEGVIGSGWRENGADGLQVGGRVIGFEADNPTISGFGHAQVGINTQHYFDRRVITAADQFTGDIGYAANAIALYVNGLPDGVGADGRRSFYVTISGSSWTATVTLQKSASTGGPWTDVKTWTSTVTELFSDTNSDDVYYRIGVKAGQLTTAGTLTVGIRTLVFPRDININVTTYDDGASTLTGAPNINLPNNRLNYHRGIGAGGVRVNIGPLKYRNLTVQNQFAGFVDVYGGDWDDTTVQYSDTSGSNNYNAGLHLNANQPLLVFQGSEYFVSWILLKQRVRFFGTKHKLGAGYVLQWDNNANDDEIEFRGGVVYDLGPARWRPNATVGASGYTRWKTPFLSQWLSSTAGKYQKLTDVFFIRGPGVDAFAARKLSGSDDQNASDAIYARVQSDDTGVPWGSGRIVRNIEVLTPEDAGFDSDLNFIRPRLTPTQTGPRGTGRPR